LLELLRSGKVEEARAIAAGLQQEEYLTSLLTTSDGADAAHLGHGGVFWGAPLALPSAAKAPEDGAIPVTVCSTVEQLTGLREALETQLEAAGGVHVLPACAQRFLFLFEDVAPPSTPFLKPFPVVPGGTLHVFGCHFPFVHAIHQHMFCCCLTGALSLYGFC
jgi:hypothetical protein